jgi:hypothetical protein
MFCGIAIADEGIKHKHRAAESDPRKRVYLSPQDIDEHLLLHYYNTLSQIYKNNFSFFLRKIRITTNSLSEKYTFIIVLMFTEVSSHPTYVYH